VAFAVVAIPSLIGVVYLGHWALAAVVAIAAVLGVREVFDLARAREIAGFPWWGYGAAVALPMGLQWTLEDAAIGQFTGRPLQLTFWAAIGAAVWLMGVLSASMRRGPDRRPLVSLGVTTFAVAYAAGLPSFLLVLRAMGAGASNSAAAGTGLAMLPLVLTWLCDTLAMTAGHAIGGPKLAPILSPNKTWAGAAAGALGALVAAPLLGTFVLAPLGVSLPTVALVAIGLAVGVLGQIGDVAESLLKREAGVKDASSLIPGHGGVLDRLDSLYFTVPVTAGIAAIALGF
jgi:phosphatidate cytidylyltransferase